MKNDTKPTQELVVLERDWNRIWYAERAEIERERARALAADVEALSARHPNVGTLLMNMDGRREVERRASAHEVQPAMQKRARAELALRTIFAIPLCEPPAKVWRSL